MVYQALDYGIPGHGDLIGCDADSGIRVLSMSEGLVGNSKNVTLFIIHFIRKLEPKNHYFGARINFTQLLLGKIPSDASNFSDL